MTLNRFRAPGALASALALMLVPGLAAAGVIFEDISPNSSTRYPDPTGGIGASGGRVNNVGSAPGTNLVFYAASEWGGIWKTEDGGATWSHLHKHVPPVTWDVAVDTLDSNIVYATSLYDGRVRPVSGIQVSRDAGLTWTHPTTALPSGLTCVDDNGATQPAPEQWSAFGIGIRPDAPQNVFIGTSCGLAISNDSGVHWSFVDPNPNKTGLTYIWDVVVQPGGPQGKGIVDVCGVEGHSRSVDGGQTWESHPLPWESPLLPGGGRYATQRCSIAASPDEPYVIFVVDDITDKIANPPFDYRHTVWESDDGGNSWVKLGKPNPADTGTKRLTFVATNKRSGSMFDLWYGEGDLWRASCTTPNPPVQPGATMDSTLRCPKATDAGGALQWSFPPPGETVETRGAHGDSGDLEFDRTKSVDACPAIYASDGGVFINRPGLGDDCHAPKFQQPDRSPHSIWLWGMAGSNLATGDVALHFGVQDDGSWAAPDALTSTPPSWQDGHTSDSYSRVADETRYLWHDQSGLHKAAPGSLSSTDVNLPAATKSDGTTVGRTIPEFGFVPRIDGFGDKKYAIVTDFIDLDDDGDTDGANEGQRVFITEDITANPVAWQELGQSVPPGPFCGLRASVDPSSPDEPVFYLLQGRDCNDDIRNLPDILYKHPGKGAATPWQKVSVPGVIPDRIGIFAVDPADPKRLYVSKLCGAGCNDGVGMMFSTDGGASWQTDHGLTDKMKGKGLLALNTSAFDFVNQGGADGTYGFRAFFFGGYAQPSLVAYDPYDPNIIVAGGKDSGIFLSTDGGKDWGLLTDPIQPGFVIPHISQPWFAHFKHEASGTVWLYLGTRGRGVWRLRVRQPVASAGGPYVTHEGTDVTLDAGASSDPDGQSRIFE